MKPNCALHRFVTFALEASGGHKSTSTIGEMQMSVNIENGRKSGIDSFFA
jgi:hypothetical protein